MMNRKRHWYIVKGIWYILSGMVLIVGIETFIFAIADYMLKTNEGASPSFIWAVAIAILIFSLVWGGIAIDKGTHLVAPPKPKTSTAPKPAHKNNIEQSE